MALQFETKRTVTVVAGMGQTGKSSFALRYLLNAPLSVRYVFDPEGEYSQRLNLAPAADAYDLGLGLCKGWVIFDPSILFAGRTIEALQFFCEWAFETSSTIPGAKCILIDEVWKYCSPQAIPHELALVTQTGRKRGLGLMVNTQLPHKLNGALLSEVSEMVCFRLQFSKALDLMQERGFDPAELSTLPDLHFVSRSETGGELAGAIEF